jgi:hypothetical protein
MIDAHRFGGEEQGHSSRHKTADERRYTPIILFGEDPIRVHRRRSAVRIMITVSVQAIG